MVPVFLLLLLLNSVDSEDCLQPECYCSVYQDEGTVKCGHLPEVSSFPFQLPPNTFKVEFYAGLYEVYFPSKLFDHESWQSVKELRFINDHFFEPGRSIILPLSSLQTLIVRNTGLDMIPFDLGNLTALTTLDLSLNSFLSFQEVEKSITNKLPNLTKLYLHGIHSAVNPPHILGEEFAKAIGHKPLKEIDLSSSGLVGFSKKVFEKNKSFSLLNISSTNLNFYVILPGNLTVDTLDLSNNRWYISAKFWKGYVGIMSYQLCHKFTMQMKRLFFHHMTFTAPTLQAYNTTVIFECNETFHIREVRLNNNNLKWLDLNIRGNFSNIRIVDVSDNKIEYISPSIIDAFHSLIELHLQWNKLYVMEHTPEFSILLRRVPDIQYLDLSNNNLHVIPFNFFVTQYKLKTLLLVRNRIETLSFDVTPMRNVLLLNASNNSIRDIGKDMLAALDFILEGQKHRNVSDGEQRLLLDLSSNPLQCNCISLAFTNWLVETNAVDKASRYCNFGNEYVFVTEANVNKIREECSYSVAKIIVLSTSLPLISLTFVILLGCYVWKMRQGYKRREYFKVKYKDENDDNFLVFLSFSGVDDVFGSRIAYDALEEGLQRKLNTDKKLVATGVIDFRPGRFIEEEIIRCIEASGVVALCISQAFIESEWCQVEGFIADRKGKPILMIVKDEVLLTYKPTKFRRLLRKYTRVTWTENHGEHHVRPDWNTVCDAVLELAGTGGAHKANNTWI